MATNLLESQALQQTIELLYNFLPGSPHPFANQDISFPGVAQKLGLGSLWPGGSKLPAIKTLLQETYKRRSLRAFLQPYYGDRKSSHYLSGNQAQPAIQRGNKNSERVDSQAQIQNP